MDHATSYSKRLTKMAHRLYLEQREARGYVRAKTLEGKPCKLVGPYVHTPENDERAATILAYRRAAARHAHPLH